jgi:uncharacterized membrane protein (UPF0127 family)
MKILLTLRAISLVFLVLLLAAMIPLMLAPVATEPGTVMEDTVTFSGPSGPVTIGVELADTPEEHSRGLMGRESLAPGRGMLFIFEGDSTRTFWMRDTLIPLDMIFINSSLDIVHMEEGAQPCTTPSCPHYTSGQPAMYVVEVNAGFVRENGISKNQRVSISVL